MVEKKKGSRKQKFSLSKWNSLKHGLLAKDVVVKFGPLKEDQDQFKQLLTDLRNDLAPVGALEEILVEEIAVCYWRLRRVVRSEVGEVMRSADPELFSPADMQRFLKDVNFESGKLDNEERMRLFGTSAGIDTVCSIVDKYLTEIQESKSISRATIDALKVLFGDDKRAKDEIEGLSYLLNTPTDKRVSLPPGMSNPVMAESPDEARELLVRIITFRVAALMTMKPAIERLEAYKRRVELLGAGIPSSDHLDTISRYETTIKRHLYRAIDQLERLKRRREGEFIPAPIKVDVRT